MAPSSSREREFPRGGSVHYFPDFVEENEREELFEALLAEHEFRERTIVLFGREVLQPRLVAWAGEMPYRYSGVTLEPRPLGSTATRLLERVRAHTGVPFNHLLLNLYRNGQDSMGLHADAEPELGRDPTIASLSLGAVRRFRIVANDPPRERAEFSLEDGSLLVMAGTLQHHTKHDLPKDPRVTTPRLNVTFRRLLRAPA